MAWGLIQAITSKWRGRVRPFRPAIATDLNEVCMVALETNTACNLRCNYCPNSKYDRGLLKNQILMEREIFKKVIDELATLNWRGEIQPSLYGEPLLDERIVELVEYVRQKLPSSKINLFSNGELLTVDRYRQLIEAGVTMFTVTPHLDGPGKNILDVISWRKEHGSDGVALVYRPLTRINSRGGLIELPYVLYKTTLCGWPSHDIVIDHAGNVILCCEDYLSQVKQGNLHTQTLLEIWNDPKNQKIRYEAENGISTFPICRNCYYGLPYKPSVWERMGFHLPTVKGLALWLWRRTGHPPKAY